MKQGDWFSTGEDDAWVISRERVELILTVPVDERSKLVIYTSGENGA